jgi:hypothetical protein
MFVISWNPIEAFCGRFQVNFLRNSTTRPFSLAMSLSEWFGTPAMNRFGLRRSHAAG